MTPITDAELLELSTLNRDEATRAQARWLPPTQIIERDGLLLVASGTRFPAGPSNSVTVLGGATTDPALVLETARSFFTPLGRGFTVMPRAHLDAELIAACEQAGLVNLGNSPGMVLRQRVETKALPVTSRVRSVAADHSAQDFVRVMAGAYESIGLPGSITNKLLSVPERWLAPHWESFVLYAADEPVSGAMLLLSHGIAGVYWVGTLPAARGRGFADAVMRAVSNRAFDLGARAVVLQATPFGEPVYKRLGYEEITRYPWYLSMFTPPA